MAFAALTPVPRFKLRRAGLVQVLCQVRFSPVLRLRQDDAVIAFQEAVRDQYPRYARQEAVGFLVTPGGIQPQEQQQPGLHRFEDTSGSLAITLAPDFVALETVAYVDIDDFVARLVRVVEIIRDEYSPAEIARIGLRFVNELRLPEANVDEALRGALNPALLGPLGAEQFEGAVQISEQVLQLADASQTVLVRHGLQRGGTTVMLPPGKDPRQPGELDRPFYLLDLDAFVEGEVPFSVEGVDARLRHFNDGLRSLFAWAVDPVYRRETLGQEDDG